jgi:hypothetical protein
VRTKWILELHTPVILGFLLSTAATGATSPVSTAPRRPGMTPSLTSHAPYTISGRLSLISANLLEAGSGCTGQGNYASIHGGAPITVTDASGRVIGVGHLAMGQRRLTDGSPAADRCDFEFVVGGLPEVEVYGIHLERHGSLQYTLTEMKRQNWAIRLELQAS